MMTTKHQQRNISPNPDAVSLDAIKLTIRKSAVPILPKKSNTAKKPSTSGQLEIIKLENESKGMEERLKVLRETLEKQKEKRGNTAYLWKSANAQKGTLNKYAEDVLAAKNASLKARYSGIGDEADTKRKIISDGDPRRLLKHGDSSASLHSSSTTSSSSASGVMTPANKKLSSSIESFMNLSVSKLSTSSSASLASLASTNPHSSAQSHLTSTQSLADQSSDLKTAARPPPMPLPIQQQQQQPQKQKQPSLAFSERVVESRYIPPPKPMMEQRMWRVPTPASGVRSSSPSTPPNYSSPPSYGNGAKIASRPSTATQAGMIANNLDVEDNVSAAATTASSVSFSVNSLMDGQVDEDQNRQDFLAALREWRNAGKQEETQQQQQKIGVSSSPAAKAAERTSMGNDNTAAALHSKRAEHQRVFDNASVETSSTGTGTAPIQPSNELTNALTKIHTSTSDLSYTEKLLRDKLRITPTPCTINSASVAASSNPTLSSLSTKKPGSADSSNSSSQENYDLETLEMGLLDRSVRIPPPLPPVAAVFKLQSTTFEIVEVMDSSIKSEYRAFTVQEPED